MDTPRDFGIGDEVIRLSTAGHAPRIAEAANWAIPGDTMRWAATAASRTFATNIAASVSMPALTGTLPAVGRILAPFASAFRTHELFQPIVLDHFAWNFVPNVGAKWHIALEAVNRMRAHSIALGEYLVDLRGRTVEVKARSHPGGVELFLRNELARTAAASDLRSWTRRRLRAPTVPPGRQQSADPRLTRGPNSHPAPDYISCGAGQAV